MIPTNTEEMAKRAAALYAEKQEPPHHAFYVVEPRQPDEMERARAVVRAALHELGAAVIELAAMGLVTARRAVLWCRQWKRA